MRVGPATVSVTGFFPSAAWCGRVWSGTGAILVCPSVPPPPHSPPDIPRPRDGTGLHEISRLSHAAGSKRVSLGGNNSALVPLERDNSNVFPPVVYPLRRMVPVGLAAMDAAGSKTYQPLKNDQDCGLRAFAARLSGFRMEIPHFFRTATNNGVEHARCYFHRLFQARQGSKKHGAMEAAVAGADYEDLRHFISGSPFQLW